MKILSYLTAQLQCDFFFISFMLNADHGRRSPPDLYAERDFSLGVKRAVLEADQSPPSSAEVMNENNSSTTSPLYLHGTNRNKGTF
jgi:hypothetical protein